jgi:Smg protein
MTDNILDVLTYMFDYLFEEADQDNTHEIDDTELKAHLSDAGFDVVGIDKALNWLENIATLQDGKIKPFSTIYQSSIRIYTYAEQQRLDIKARGFLLFMENIGQLDASQREMIIEQVMSLGETKIDLEDLKWVVMMVLGNSIDSEISAQWLESIVFLDENRTLQ